MIYLDSTVLVDALNINSAHHKRSLSRLESGDVMTSTHALAETFSALTGKIGMQNELVAESLEELAGNIVVETVSLEDYLTVFRSVRMRGVMGGLVYDALHAAVAKRAGATQIVTRNLSDFTQVASDMQISAP